MVTVCIIGCMRASFLGTQLPIIQAPMAGVQVGALAAAASAAGGLGSLPCAVLAPEAIAKEIEAITSRSGNPYNVNFFCHTPPAPDARREAEWRRALAPYYREYDIDVEKIPAGGDARHSRRKRPTCSKR